MTPNDLEQLVANAYKLGFVNGLQCFAHWKDGVEYVGTCGKTLRAAIEKVETLHNYDSPVWIPTQQEAAK